jgi:broad specificity phosphatase PhoE
LINFDAIYCSPLLRCIQTTDFLINSKEVFVDDNLLEHSKDINELSNKRQEKEKLTNCLNLLNNTYNLSNVKAIYNYAEESNKKLYERIKLFLTHIGNTYSENTNILIVTHHDWLYKCFTIYNILDIRSINNCEIYHILLEKPKPGSIIKLYNQSNYMNTSDHISTLLLNMLQIPNMSITLLPKESIIDIVSRFVDINCNYTLLHTIYRFINKKFLETYSTTDKIFDFYTKKTYTKMYHVMFKYYYNLNKKFNEGYQIFSLGDSLDKLNIFWNLVNNHRKQIITIPFSGAAFDDDDDGDAIKLNTKTAQDMYNKFSNLLENNNYFYDLVNALQTNKKVLITDFMSTGKSFLTILLLFTPLKI